MTDQTQTAPSGAPPSGAPPSTVTDAVLVPSNEMPEGSQKVEELDFNSFEGRPITVDDLMSGMNNMGFQASSIGEAVRIINNMVCTLFSLVTYSFLRFIIVPQNTTSLSQAQRLDTKIFQKQYPPFHIYLLLFLHEHISHAIFSLCLICFRLCRTSFNLRIHLHTTNYLPENTSTSNQDISNNV